MSIMDLFRPGAKQQEPVQQTANGQQTTPATPTLKQEEPQADPAAKPAGMDKFNDLWTPTQKKEGAPPEFNPGAIFNLDPESMQKAVGQINFADSITKEDMQAILAGGEDAVAAFARSMNSVSAKTMTLSTSAAAKMIEQALSQASGAMDGKIDTRVKLNQVNSQMQELNPALSHPAARPIVDALKVQFTNKHPMASASEISAMVQEYMVDFTNVAAGKKEPESAASKGTNWEDYMKG